MNTRALSISALILEDDPLWRVVLTKTIDEYVQKVISCVSLQEALDAWERERPGLVLVDIGLSGENGLEFIERVRRENGTVPVVVVSGDESQEVAVRAINIGVNRFVRKPASPEELESVVEEVLARYQLLEERRSREQYFRTLVEQGSDTVIVYDRNRNPVYRVDAGTGDGHERPGYRFDPDALPFSGDAALWNAAFRDALSAPAVIISTVVRVRDWYEDVRWLDVRLRNLLDHPDVQGVVVNARDITRERRTQSLLQQAEERLRRQVKLTEYQYRVLFELLPVGVLIRDGSDTLLECNPAAKTILDGVGRIPDGVTFDTNAWNLVDSEGNPLSPEELPAARCRNSGEPVRDSVVGIKRRGRPLQWLNINVTPFTYDPADSGTVMVVVEDISDTIHREREQRLLLKRMERTTANLHFINTWLTETTRVDEPLTHLPGIIDKVESIPFLAHLAVYQGDEVTGVFKRIAHHGEGIWPDTVNLDDQLREYLNRSGGLVVTERLGQILREQLDPRTLDSISDRLLFYPVTDQEAARGVVLFGSRAGYGRQVREVCGALAGTIAVMFQKERDRKARELAEEARRRQKQFLARAERLAALGSLTSAIGHEINQPLQSIKIIAESTLYWINEGASPPDPRTTKESLERISERADWAADIVRSMKTVFRKPELIEIVPVDVDNVARQSIEVLRELPEARDVSFEIDLDPEVFTFPFSEVQLKQVLMNLMKNAVRILAASGQSEGLIRVRTGRREGCKRIEVMDNGPGIPDEIKDRVFDPFFTTSDRAEGMGLGLYVVHTVVRAMQCTVCVEDAPGGGACFVIEEDLPESSQTERP